MAKNRFTMQPQQTTPSMSLSYPHTVSVVASVPSPEDEDDNDICPVCDGECTCNNKPRSLGPLSMAELSRQCVASTSSSIPSPPPKPSFPSLKIKFTVPPNLLGKKRQFTTSNPKKSKSAEETTSVGVNAGDVTPPPYPVAGPSSVAKPSPSIKLSNYAPPRKRGRPRKVVIATRDPSVDSTPDIAPRLHSSAPSKRSSTKSAILGKQKRPYTPKVAKNLKARGTIVKRSPAKRRRVVNGSSGSSDLSDTNNAYDPDDDDDVESVQFPTFVSASALSSMGTDDSDSLSSLSDFDSDSSIEAEEETFILSEVQEKARLKRELLGDGVQKRDQHNDWVIRPRKKSVGLSDVEMDIDTDATEDDDDEEVKEAEEEEEEEETDGRSTGAGYPGLVTGWSDDEESSFDADIFFANLSGSDSDSSSMKDYQDDGESEALTEAGLLHMREELENLPLELTESWDGQIVFTNGVQGSQGIIDMDFEVNASQYVADASSPPSHASDVDMSSSDVDDGGYEEDGGEGEGDTTDEELVGDDDLPNERAMRLFSLPPSVSAINPLSTVSPAVSPGPRGRVPFSIHGKLDSPSPAGILAGRVFWDSDDHDDFDERRSRSFSLSSSKSTGPRTGVFVPTQEARQAVIDDSHKGIPSPHPRFNRARGKINGRLNAVEALLRKHLSTSRHDFATISGHAPLRLLPSVHTSGSNEIEPLAEPIELDDVLEASFLHPDPIDEDHPPDSTTADESDSRQDLKHLRRWDVISVGAFRNTRESGILDSPGASWASDSRHTPASSADYGNVLKASPLSTMLWPSNDKSKKSKRSLSTLSPMIIPNRGDGDRTPTNLSLDNTEAPQSNHNRHEKYPHKTRKELRRERKPKRKNYGPNIHSHHPPHHYHSHHHHPNSKTRSSSSSQRTNFLSSVPLLNM